MFLFKQTEVWHNWSYHLFQSFWKISTEPKSFPEDCVLSEADVSGSMLDILYLTGVLHPGVLECGMLNLLLLISNEKHLRKFWKNFHDCVSQSFQIQNQNSFAKTVRENEQIIFIAKPRLFSYIFHIFYD